MPNKTGDFVWYELITDDIDASQAFYSQLLGWEVAEKGGSDPAYRIMQAPEAGTGASHGIGGLLQLTAEMSSGGASPTWLGYIAVDDVESCAAKAGVAGGRTLMPPRDIPETGCVAMLADPQGIPFYVIRPSGEGDSLAFAADKPRPGHCAWNELVTHDADAAKTFYGQLFGWQKDGELDMGALGPYEFLRHGGLIGAVARTSDVAPRPMWQFYFRVKDIDRAVEQIAELGGQLQQGPDEIPGGEYALNGTDPQGATFSLVGSR
ncbi:VOC family protein [Microbulbifer sp. YPW16]|uniref:VOC family protein n=1 Tax=Microbulbifer sp. YPW16 TaxID=2904242 RepID=UPI001E2AC550|nr:VOC family protein [Microbulbifer sp. YPW16]UHQ55442.1 VOC family protein [Microbulbifer sp. YPW16]